MHSRRLIPLYVFVITDIIAILCLNKSRNIKKKMNKTEDYARSRDSSGFYALFIERCWYKKVVTPILLMIKKEKKTVYQ